MKYGKITLHYSQITVRYVNFLLASTVSLYYCCTTQCYRWIYMDRSYSTLCATSDTFFLMRTVCTGNVNPIPIRTSK